VRPGNENNENKYVPRVQHVRYPRRSRYVCYSGIDFAKDENVFRRTRLNAVSDWTRIGIWCRAIVDGTIISFLAPLPFSVDRESRS